MINCSRKRGDRQDTVDNQIVRRLIWTGLVAAMSALASVVATRLSAAIYVRIFHEDPPE